MLAADALKDAIIRHARHHANADGLALTPIPGLRMMCAHRPSEPMRSIYKPLVCLVLQGAKQMTIGTRTHTFVAGTSVIVGTDAPVTGKVVSASPDQPYLALAIELDFAVIRELATKLPATDTGAAGSANTLLVGECDAAALECGLRLMRLIERPDAAAVLRPGIIKELHYWLLSGQHGAALNNLALPDGHAQRITAAVQVLRDGFAQRIPVGQLAVTANMSPSAFHRHFKAITSLTPIQFQKQLRLVEARRLMQSEGRAASSVAYDVGYESVSQFTREYARMFGAPPRRDSRTGMPSSRRAPGNRLAAAA